MGKRARSQTGPFHGLCGYAVTFRSAVAQSQRSEASSSLRGVALRERDEGGDLGQCMYILHEDGLIRAWAAADVLELKKSEGPNAVKLDRKQLKLKEEQRPFHRGSVAARKLYYSDELTPGTGLELWSELDHAWCKVTVAETPLYYDKEAQTLGSTRPPFVNVTYVGEGEAEVRAAIELDSDVWRLPGETAAEEAKRQNHRSLLILPETGTSVTRAFASPCVTLAQQMQAEGDVPSVVLSEAMAVFTQVCQEGGKVKEKKVLVELPVKRDMSAGLDASFDDLGVMKVVYVAKRHEVLGSGDDR